MKHLSLFWNSIWNWRRRVRHVTRVAPNLNYYRFPQWKRRPISTPVTFKKNFSRCFYRIRHLEIETFKYFPRVFFLVLFLFDRNERVEREWTRGMGKQRAIKSRILGGKFFLFSNARAGHSNLSLFIALLLRFYWCWVAWCVFYLNLIIQRAVL